MPLAHANERFFMSTRGHIITLLRRSGHTVDELAQELKLTDNAIRSHLATLERDGLVHQMGERRSGGKPAFVYQLTPEAQQLFPQPYGLVLLYLLDALDESMAVHEREVLLRTVGRRLATHWSIPGGDADARARLDRAVEALNQLGGLAELEQRNDISSIRGYSCPFAAIAPNHPEVCQLAETFLSELIGTPVQQRCDNVSSPQCSFVVLSPAPENA